MDEFELRDHCVELALKNGWSVHETVDKELPNADLDDESYYELARAGLIYRVNSEMASARKRGESEPTGGGGGKRKSGNKNQKPKPEDKSARFYWLGKYYYSADGHTRPLLDFTYEDFEYCEEWARGRANQFHHRAEFFSRCRMELSESRELMLAELPPATLAELDIHAGQVLGG